MKKQIYNLQILILLILLTTNFLFAEFNRFIDTVYYFQPGTGQNNGQSSEYFPLNIFGPPSKNASSSIPEASPNEVLSIGLSGEIIVGFKNAFIKDGPGIDFIIFENAFVNPINKQVFAEPAVVSVSEDGINFIDFPFNTLTLEGCAGTNPTIGKENPFDYPNCGGNGFDIATVGLTKIKYIKIKDITEIVLQNQNHPFYNPTLSGFDLDAVAGLYVIDEGLNTIKDNSDTVNHYILDIYDYLGNKVTTYQNISLKELYSKLERGCYFVVMYSHTNYQYKRICIN